MRKTKVQLEQEIVRLTGELNKLTVRLESAREIQAERGDTNNKLARENIRLWGVVDRLVDTLQAGAKEAIWPRRPVPL
jgi:hypothetical protein